MKKRNILIFLFTAILTLGMALPVPAAEQGETRSRRMSDTTFQEEEVAEAETDAPALSLGSTRAAGIQADDGSVTIEWEGYTAEVLRYDTTKLSNGSADLDLYFHVTNHSDRVLDLWMEEVTIDGVKLLGTGVYDAEPGMDEEDYILVIPTSDNKEEGADAIVNGHILQGTLYLVDSDTLEKILLQEVTVDLNQLESEHKDYSSYASSSKEDTQPSSFDNPPAPSYTTLRQGDTGEAVRALQEKLVELGYLNDIPDGSYGPKTAQAVKDFNEANGLDGGTVADYTMQNLAFSGLANRYTEPYIPLQIGANFEWDPVSNVNTFFYRVQVTNHSKTRTIKGYELNVYTTNVWGEKLDGGVTYSQSMTQSVAPGETLYSAYFNLGNWYSVDTVWVGISRIIFDDGEIREADDVEYYSCVLPSRIQQ